MFGLLLKPIRKRFGPDRHYYKILDDIFGIFPNNIELYKLALIHRSASVFLSDGTSMNNERLEFLGDAVLEAIVSDYLFVEFPEHDEGFLTQMRSKIVSRQSLNELSVKLGLSEHIISNAGGSFVQKHLYGNAFEAMVGAIYLDKGYNFVNRLMIVDILRKYLDIEQIMAIETDFKSRLIEWCQKSKHTISFHTDLSENSTVQNPMFRSVAIVDEMELGFGMGASKKEAEQVASYAVSQMMSDELGNSFLDWVDGRLKSNGRGNGGK